METQDIVNSSSLENGSTLFPSSSIVTTSFDETYIHPDKLLQCWNKSRGIDSLHVILVVQKKHVSAKDIHGFYNVMNAMINSSTSSIPILKLSKIERAKMIISTFETLATNLEHILTTHDGFFPIDKQFTLHHSFVDIADDQLLSTAQILIQKSKHLGIQQILLNIEIGQVFNDVVRRKIDIEAFGHKLGFALKTVEKYRLITDTCKAYPRLPFLDNISHYFIGQYNKHIRKAIGDNDCLYAMLIKPTPIFKEGKVDMKFQYYTDTTNPYLDSSKKFKATI